VKTCALTVTTKKGRQLFWEKVLPKKDLCLRATTENGQLFCGRRWLLLMAQPLKHGQSDSDVSIRSSSAMTWTLQGRAGDQLHQLCHKLLCWVRHLLRARLHVQEIAHADWQSCHWRWASTSTLMRRILFQLFKF